MYIGSARSKSAHLMAPKKSFALCVLLVFIGVPVSRLTHGCVPARAEFLLLAPQDRKRTLRMQLCTGHQQSVDGGNYGDVRSMKRGTGDRGDPAGIRKSSNRTFLTICQSKRRYAIVVGTDQRIHRILKTAAKTDGDQQVFRTQEQDLLSQIARRTNRRLGIVANRNQPIR